MTGPAARVPQPPRQRQRPPLYLRRPLVAGLVRQWPLFIVIVIVAVGLLLVAADEWRRGLVVMGLALILAGLLRLLLPLRRIGFLAVRSRPVDVALTTGAGLAVVVITLATPYR
jgi:MFS superfamily sulfate permease-like transporter